MFPTLPETEFSFSVTFILSSANAFNLDQSNILLSGKGLIADANNADQDQIAQSNLEEINVVQGAK